jgi:hypothetical protein
MYHANLARSAEKTTNAKSKTLSVQELIDYGQLSVD